MYVEEKNRSWFSSSTVNDQRAITIECASDNTEPYAFKYVVYKRRIELCTDICKRNGKTKLLLSLIHIYSAGVRRNRRLAGMVLGRM